MQEPIPLALGIRSSSRDTLVIIPPSTPVPTRQTRIYYATCQSEITFDILEGLFDPEQEANRNLGTTPKRLEHCMGRVLLDGSRASAPLILKLEIAFEVDATDRLTVVVSDNSNNRVTRLLIAGDETCLSTEALALAQTYLGEVLRNSAATDGSKSSPSLALTSSSEVMPTIQGCPIKTLRACVATLKPLVLTNHLSVCIPPGDTFFLHSRIEKASAWLDQLGPSQKNSQITDLQTRTAREHLRQIRLLHLSSAASSALVQLRQELDLLN